MAGRSKGENKNKPFKTSKAGLDKLLVKNVEKLQ